MTYETISLVEMDDFLRQRRFKPVDLYFRRRPVKEWVYERRLPQNANHFVRVYTTIQRYGGKADQSRDVGKDAIRVQVIYRDEKGETLVSMPKRVNRVSTWRDNLDDRLTEVAESLPKVKMDRRGEPMTLRKKRGNLFWGSRDYPNYKETQPFRAEEKILCSNCNWSWNRSEGGDDLFMCHKCGTDTQVFNSESKDSKQGVAVLYPEDSQVSGVVRFQPVTDGLLISYQIKGLTDGKHGFHIHEYGDLTDGCTSACAHFNPDGDTHGGLETKIRHFGDLGNIVSTNGLSKGYLFLKNGCLDGSKYSILGRMIIVHADPDDLGKGGDEESLKTGNAGKRLACGVIGLADPKDAVDKKAETVRECCQCGKTDGLNTIQAGTYCYDCLPINLGAEDIIYVSPNEEIDIDAKIETIENTGQKVARIDWFETPKGNGFGRAEFENFRDWAYKQGAAYIVVESVPESVNFWKWMGFIEPFGLVEPKDEFLATHLGLNTLIYLAESEAEGGQFAAEDNYDATYGKKQAKIRRRLKNKIMKQNIMGTAANKWSARKSQELKRQYEKACEKAGLASYKGSKTAKQDDLSNWSKQKWTTASGKKSSVTGEPYFPEKAVAALKKRGLYAKAKRQKQKANKAKKNARYSDDIREVVGQFRAEDINQKRSNNIINILLLEWLMVTNEKYDSLTMTKGLVDYIDDSPYDFVRHMQNQDFHSLMPSSHALVPADFLYYLKDKDRDHWSNMKSRAISKERYQIIKEQISVDQFWLSDIHKANYYQWLPRSAINYQNI